MQYAVFKASDDQYLIARRGLSTFYRWQYPTPMMDYWFRDFPRKKTFDSEDDAIAEMNRWSGDEKLIVAESEPYSAVKRFAIFLLNL